MAVLLAHAIVKGLAPLRSATFEFAGLAVSLEELTLKRIVIPAKVAETLRLWIGVTDQVLATPRKRLPDLAGRIYIIECQAQALTDLINLTGLRPHPGHSINHDLADFALVVREALLLARVGSDVLAAIYR